METAVDYTVNALVGQRLTCGPPNAGHSPLEKTGSGSRSIGLRETGIDEEAALRFIFTNALNHLCLHEIPNDSLGAGGRHQRRSQGISTGVVLWLIGVQSAILFGTLTFLGALVPTVGPVIMALPALFVALSLGVTKFLLALACVLFVQQVESTVLVPFVLGREMRLNPAVILFSTLVMGSMFGIAGATLSVPTAAFLSILVDEFYLRPRELDYAALDREASTLVEGKDAPRKRAGW